MNRKEPLGFAFKPQKALGQNFLTSSFYLTRIADACQLDNNANVVEIGVGYGSLTDHILGVKPRKITCIEKDPRLFSWLNSRLSLHGEGVNFLLADALEVEWEGVVEPSPNIQQRAIVVGNLPYNIANQLVNKLVRKGHLFKRLVFLVQKEVAQRWVASCTSYRSKYSSLSIILNYFCRTELVFEVPRCFFKPQPPVEGAVVSFEFRDSPVLDFPVDKFFTFVRSCFRFRRKTLLNNLRSFRGGELPARRALTLLNLPERVRPQDLSIEEYLQLFKIA